ncbi:oleandomycin transport system permease protein [Tamaricihabitans halophyticus]|uniref:Transport permease protein n=1 Tax=Tamaricihabitans halophyticus TaxID=1262583 RepID=A0A4R2R1Y3_9PSEU|nr:ABC transporter permease [Tamaricihabitans halophyticus]TCP56712.1 oleandomycin transport system permease protein [Tamaricihabitans halophyticus]
MTTATMTAERTPAKLVSPAKLVKDSFAMAWRGVLKIRKNPEQLSDVTLMPILFLVMFGYIFGGAVQGSTEEYLQVFVPGLVVMITIMASMSAGISLNTDVSKGVFDRFRAMPIARSAPLVGAVVADFVRYVVGIGVLLGFAAILGFRITTDPLSTLAAVAIAIAFGLAFCWIAMFIGILVKSPGALAGIMMAIVMPFTFGSNVFVPTETMPDWLAAWSEISPVSLLADVMRGLLVDGGDITGPLLGSLAWMGALLAVFFPLTIRTYLRRLG